MEHPGRPPYPERRPPDLHCVCCRRNRSWLQRVRAVVSDTAAIALLLLAVILAALGTTLLVKWFARWIW